MGRKIKKSSGEESVSRKADENLPPLDGQHGDVPEYPEGRQALPLFYRKVEILSPTDHGGLSVKQTTNFGYAADTDHIPLLVNEFVDAQRFYPIVFSGGDQVSPFVLVGGFNGGNLFIDQKGAWERGCYIPAYVRRYPFISARVPVTDRWVMAIDPNAPLVGEGDFRPLYQDEDPTSVLEDAVDFCRNYAVSEEYTSGFCQALGEYGLLVDGNVNLKLFDDKLRRYSGFLVIDRDAFNGLSSEVIEDWREKGWLEAIYAHFASFGAWEGIRMRLLKEATPKRAPANSPSEH